MLRRSLTAVAIALSLSLTAGCSKESVVESALQLEQKVSRLERKTIKLGDHDIVYLGSTVLAILVIASVVGAVMARSVHQLMQALGVQQFHLVGNSMGGYIGAYYAAHYPQQVQTLGLFDAAGVDSPNKTTFMKELLAGNNLMLPKDREDFGRVLKLVMEDPPYIPTRPWLTANSTARCLPSYSNSNWTWRRICRKSRHRHCCCGAIRTV